MKTRCPTCKTRYNIDPEALLEADGLARCFRCGTVFEIVPDGSIEPNIIDMPTERPAFETDEDSVFLEDLEADASAPVAHNADDSVVVRSVSSEQADIRQQPETSPTATETADTIENAADAGGELPFAVPEDLKPIEPSPDDVQDIADTLQCSLEGEADHILATRFLNRFVDKDIDWVHVDLAASNHKGGLGHIPTDTTGFGVRYTLNLLLQQALLETEWN